MILCESLVCSHYSLFTSHLSLVTCHLLQSIANLKLFVYELMNVLPERLVKGSSSLKRGKGASRVVCKQGEQSLIIYIFLSCLLTLYFSSTFSVSRKLIFGVQSYFNFSKIVCQLPSFVRDYVIVECSLICIALILLWCIEWTFWMLTVLILLPWWTTNGLAPHIKGQPDCLSMSYLNTKWPNDQPLSSQLMVLSTLI